MTTADQRDLLRAISLNPKEDTPRLMLADEIETNATTDVERARAKLIRLQVELSQIGYFDYLDYFDEDGQIMARGRELRLCEKQLISTYSATWRRPTCPTCGAGESSLRCHRCRELVAYSDQHHSGEEYDGTWVCSVGGTCSACHGTGSCGALSGRRDSWYAEAGDKWDGGWTHPVTYSRGMPVVTVQWGNIGSGGSNAAHGEIPWDFNPEWMAWAIRCVVEEGASFILADCEPAGHVEPGATTWGWYRFSHRVNGHDRHVLTSKVWDALRDWSDFYGGRWKHYSSPKLAHAALDAALTAIVVERAYPNVEATS